MYPSIDWFGAGKTKRSRIRAFGGDLRDKECKVFALEAPIDKLCVNLLTRIKGRGRETKTKREEFVGDSEAKYFDMYMLVLPTSEMEGHPKSKILVILGFD